MKTDNLKTTSYNETRNREVRLRHIFFPGVYGLVSESVIAVVALIWFNLSQFSNQVLGEDFGADPFSMWYRPIGHILDKLDQYHMVQQATLFLIWAVVGALIYILIFRAIQISLNVEHSVGTGVRFIRQDPNHGLIRWLGSLHDFFVKMLVVLVGVAAIIAGALVCFGIASQELRNGLVGTFPGNAGPLLLSLVGAILSVRLIVLGISLTSTRFKNWYTS